MNYMKETPADCSAGGIKDFSLRSKATTIPVKLQNTTSIKTLSDSCDGFYFTNSKPVQTPCAYTRKRSCLGLGLALGLVFALWD